MTHPRSSLLGLPALLATLAGCAAPPGSRVPADVSQGRAAGPAAQHPGPGWLLLGTTEDGALYMHPVSTLRVGSSAFIMVVANRRRPVPLPSGGSVSSIKERIEIDCDNRRYRRRDGTAHPDHVGLGPVLGRVGPEPWRQVSPDTVMAAVSSAVCSATAPDRAAPDGGEGASPAEPSMPRLPRGAGRVFRT